MLTLDQKLLLVKKQHLQNDHILILEQHLFFFYLHFSPLTSLSFMFKLVLSAPGDSFPKVEINHTCGICHPSFHFPLQGSSPEAPYLLSPQAGRRKSFTELLSQEIKSPHNLCSALIW